MLFSPLKLRGVVAANRAVVSPMVQYRATDGLVNDYHLVHPVSYTHLTLPTIYSV